MGAACSSEKASPSLTAVKVGYVPIADCLQLYVGLERGIFAKHGLDVQVTSLQAGQRIIEAMVAGDLQIGIANVVSTTAAYVQGIPLVSFTGGAMEVPDQKTRALLVASSSNVRTATDLAGRRVAVNGLRNIEHVKLRQYLELHGVPVDKVNVVEAPFPQMEGVLMNGSVDAAMAIEPFLSLALKHGTVRVLGHPYTETADRTFVSSYVVLEPWLKDNEDTARAFATAIAEATTFINVQPGEAREIVLKYTRLPDEVANEVKLPKFEAHFEAALIQPMLDELARQQVIPKPVAAENVFRKLGG